LRSQATPDVAQLQVHLAGEFQTFPGITSPIRYASGLDRSTNVFCMYAINSLETPTRIHERNHQFGEAFAYVTHVDEFLRRVLSALPQGTRARSGLVEYVDSDHYTGPMAPFRKRREFEHQSEFRIAVTPGTDRDLTLQVGELSEIVFIGYTREIAGQRVRVVSG